MAESLYDYGWPPSRCGDAHSWWWEPSLCPVCHPGPDVPLWPAEGLPKPRTLPTKRVDSKRPLWWDA